MRLACPFTPGAALSCGAFSYSDKWEKERQAFQELLGVSLDSPHPQTIETTAQGPAHSCQEGGRAGTGQTAHWPLSPPGHPGPCSEMTLSRPSWDPVVYISRAARSVRPAPIFGESGPRDYHHPGPAEGLPSHLFRPFIRIIRQGLLRPIFSVLLTFKTHGSRHPLSGLRD